MPVLVRPRTTTYRSWTIDSRRWDRYSPRTGDIVVATYPKCGTSWITRIVSMLIAGSAEPTPTGGRWLDARFRPVDSVLERIEAQTERRMLTAHLPIDGLPLYDDVDYIHVARDGRDACMSYHNHCLSYTRAMLELLDRNGIEDETIRRPYPRPSADPGEFFRDWITGGMGSGHARPVAELDYFSFQNSWWQVRRRPNVLMVHYNDLKNDLAGEIARIARFLRIDCAGALLAEIVRAAGFEAMRRDGAILFPVADDIWEGGASSYLYKGSNNRWRDVLTKEDIDQYEAKATATLDSACASWVAAGRAVAGDPREL
jgi:aryl sulfotransferase